MTTVVTSDESTLTAGEVEFEFDDDVISLAFNDDSEPAQNESKIRRRTRMRQLRTRRRIEDLQDLRWLKAELGDWDD